MNSDQELICFFQAVEEKGGYDLVVLDVPLNSKTSEKLGLCCERLVNVWGYTPSAQEIGNIFHDHLVKLSSSLSLESRIYIFSPMEDDESFSEGYVDIHGQFGAEVRILAEEMYGPV